jgi:hypothetical protein
MAIGSLSDLFNSSQGRMVRRVATPPPPNTPVVPYKGTVSRISELATDKYAMGNPSLNRAISSPARGGLSSGGKYGGFFSATDQQAAIEGSAINLRENVGPDLQAKAEAFYKKIDPMYGEASKGPSRYYMKPGMSQMPGVDPNRTNVTQGGYIDKIVNPSREYANKLNDWYQTQSAPAQEYMGTAQRIAATPLSQLAAQTAVAGYGMNPDLATSKFANLDYEYLKRTRDAQSINEYGVPYDEFKAKQDDLLYGTSEKKLALQDERVASAELDRVTGLGSKYLSATTGQTATQMYNILGKEFKFNNPQTKTEENTSGAFFAQQYSQYLRDGKSSEASTLLNSIPSDKQDLKRLLLAIQSVFTSKAGKSAIATMTYDPLSGLDVNP